MILRTFVFRVKRKKRRAVVGFMRREALKLLRRIPACRAAYFVQSPKPKGPNRAREYMWVTLWPNQRAVRVAQKRKDWRRVVRVEEGEYFAGKPKASHYEVLLKK